MRDWASAEEMFLKSGHHGLTLKEISERLSIPYQSVRRYAAKYEWHNKRYMKWLEKRHGFTPR